MEWVEMCLVSIIKTFGSLNEDLIAAYTKQILNGLSYLHRRGVIHRDIKASNILITKEGIVKLADFGISAKVKSASEKHFTVVGSPYWMAPEVIEVVGHTTASDIWSVGCTIIEMITGKPPYFDKPQLTAMYLICKNQNPALPEQISDNMSSFLSKCFERNPEDRPNADELLKHEFIGSNLKKSDSMQKIEENIKTFTIKLSAEDLKLGLSPHFKRISRHVPGQADVEEDLLGEIQKIDHQQYFTKEEIEAYTSFKNNRATLLGPNVSVRQLQEHINNLGLALERALFSKLSVAQALENSMNARKK